MNFPVGDKFPSWRRGDWTRRVKRLHCCPGMKKKSVRLWKMINCQKMTIANFSIHSSSSSQSFTYLTETATSCFTASKGTNMEGKRWNNWLLQWQTQVQTVRQLVVTMTNTSTHCETIGCYNDKHKYGLWDNWLLQWQTQVQAVRQLVVTMTNTSTNCETIGCYNDKHKYGLWDNWLLQWQTQVQIVRLVSFSDCNSRDSSLFRQQGSQSPQVL